MTKQLQIRFLFRENLQTDTEENRWTKWIDAQATSRDNDFVKVVINDNSIQYHAVPDISSFETRIIDK